MLLSIHHVTRYRFPAPMRGVVQSHRLVPPSFDGQRILDWSVDVPKAILGTEFADGAGNITRTISVLGPVADLSVEVNGTVETEDRSGVMRGVRQAVPPVAYLRTTRFTRPDLALTELSMDALEGVDEPLGRAHALSSAVAKAVVYSQGTTGEATTAAEALAAGKGVCQDHAHTLIAAAVIAGLPARYVTGYLYSGEIQLQRQDGETQEQTSASALNTDNEASHAWAELWVEGLGWVGFDPSNQCCPDERYVRLACGFDATDAAPIRGVTMGVGVEHLEVDVSVQQVQQ